AGPPAVLSVLHAGHPGADLRGVRLRRPFLAHRRTLHRHRRGPAGLPLQVGDPNRGRPGDGAGAGRDRSLHRMPAHWRLALAARGRRGDRRGPDAARRQRVRGRRVAPGRTGGGARDRRGRPPPHRGGAQEPVSDPSLGLTMLALIVVAIMMGFPTAFTLMGLGMIFGYLAFWVPGAHWYDNRIFDLIVQRTYGVMTNDTLLSVPLFVFMGYIMERAALVDRMFHSVQLAFRRVPASLAVTTLLVCAFWGIASGIVGAVVVLMGVIAMRPMLNAGYDVKLASGAITAGGTLGILIPPSVMLIVYAAVAGQSIVKLYAAAMLPGFFLTGLYLVYILGWAIWNPKIAPKLRPDQYRVTVPDYLRQLEGDRSGSVVPGLVAAAFRPALARIAGGYGVIANNLLALSVPLLLTVGTFAGAWWYVVIYNAPVAATAVEAKPAPLAATPSAPAPSATPKAAAPPATTDEQPQEWGMAGDPTADAE